MTEPHAGDYAVHQQAVQIARRQQVTNERSTPATTASTHAFGYSASVKMLWNIAVMIATKMRTPQNLCVTMRSRRSLSVSRPAAVSTAQVGPMRLTTP